MERRGVWTSPLVDITSPRHSVATIRSIIRTAERSSTSMWVGKPSPCRSYRRYDISHLRRARRNQATFLLLLAENQATNFTVFVISVEEAIFVLYDIRSLAETMRKRKNTAVASNDHENPDHGGGRPKGGGKDWDILTCLHSHCNDIRIVTLTASTT